MSLPSFNGPLSLVDIITHFHRQVETAKILAVISCTMLIWDWVTSLHLEAAYIWGTPWSLGRVAYHFNRIWTVITLFSTLPAFLFSPDLPNITTCKQLVLLYGYGNAIELSMICSVFLMRCWALYNQRHVLVALLVGLTGTVLISLVLIKVLADKAIFVPNFLPAVFSGCLVVVPPQTWTIYIVPLLYDVTMFTLTLWKVWSLSQDFGASPLMQQLIKNGAFHSAVLITILLFSCIGGANEAIKIAAHGSGFLAASLSIACSRAILSLHIFAGEERKKHLPSAKTSGRASELRFADPVPLTTFSSSSGAQSRNDSAKD